MRKFFMIFLLIICLIGPAWAEEEEEVPFLTLNIVLKAWITPIGLGAEVLLGHLGIGGTFTVFFLGSPEGNYSFYLYEPGVYVHFYFFDPAASFYVLGDASFTMLGIRVGGEEVIDTADYESGILNLKGGVGFNAFFGKDNKIHFSAELGVHYFTFILEGEEVPIPEDLCCTPVLPFLQLQFGMGLF